MTQNMNAMLYAKKNIAEGFYPTKIWDALAISFYPQSLSRTRDDRSSTAR